MHFEIRMQMICTVYPPALSLKTNRVTRNQKCSVLPVFITQVFSVSLTTQYVVRQILLWCANTLVSRNKELLWVREYSTSVCIKYVNLGLCVRLQSNINRMTGCDAQISGKIFDSVHILTRLDKELKVGCLAFFFWN